MVGQSPTSETAAGAGTRAGDTDADGREIILKARGVTVGFGDSLILKDLDLDVRRGEILGFVGGSGTGKSVLMRTILRLMPKRAAPSRSLARIWTSCRRTNSPNRSSSAGACCSRWARCFRRSP